MITVTNLKRQAANTEARHTEAVGIMRTLDTLRGQGHLTYRFVPAEESTPAQLIVTFLEPLAPQKACVTLRTSEKAREALRSAGVSISQWAVANQFSPNLVFEVLGGRKKCIRGQSHNIAVKLGLKDGTVTKDPANALET